MESDQHQISNVEKTYFKRLVDLSIKVVTLIFIFTSLYYFFAFDRPLMRLVLSFTKVSQPEYDFLLPLFPVLVLIF